ncbi:MAG: bifunctional diaminohydroxyphosphoribosylaminopyrimidine deaminase/5-amino-6-(5-phosphoribosylamino)uracil reductase RibD, partial [Clostridium sp.]
MRQEYMRRAIELAKRGLGRVNPNPLVGAVIVKDDHIIAEGYHARYGDLHAERSAFSKLKDPAEAIGAEMYVTLEPCCHQGKQPPCTQAIIEHGIRKVYVGSDDPNALVAGKGIRILREAGIEVETHVLKEECDALNPVFFHYITSKTPYVVMKYAMTMDGKI